MSYAHADEAVASRLHHALETYSIPKNLDLGEVKKLSPIFRDTTELTAHHDLSEKIREAVTHSKFLIVLCSSAAKASHWVNEEIRLFRKLHGEASILCVLAEGTPDTSFPPALLEGGREPLAANLSGGKDSFKLGTTQLAASMLGVGLDTLIQREGKRRRRRLQLITASALAFSAVMGVTAFTAVEARNEALESRAQAEGLVEFMITDLKDKLEPVGRLDILDSVGERAVEYYEAQDIRDLSDESLSRQARARHVLGQVAIDARRREDAIRETQAAARLTAELLSRNPDDTDAIFAHAQSEYWVGKIYHVDKNWPAVLKHWTSYKLLAEKLYNTDPKNIDWVMEAGYGENNLGNLAMEQGNYQDALAQFKAAINLYNDALDLAPDNQKPLKSLANSYAGVSLAARNLSDTALALQYSELTIKTYDNLSRLDPNNFFYIFRKTEIMADLINDQFISKESYGYNKLVQDIHDGYELITKHDPENKLWEGRYKFFLDRQAKILNSVKTIKQ